MNAQDRTDPGRRRHGADFRLKVLCLLLLLIGLGLIVQLPGRSAAMAERRKNDVDFREFADLFAEIYSKVSENYVDEVESKKLFEGALNGMMATLDPYSSWLPPQEQDDLTKDTEGEYSGVGLHITLDDRRVLTVMLPILGSPGARAGVQAWDRIIEIDGQTTENITMPEAVKRLTGPEGSEVKIKVWRPSAAKLIEVSMRREQIKVQSVFHKVFEDGIGYLRIAKFQDDTANGVQDALREFNKQKVRGVIVDVRYNAGGLLERAQEICDMFLEKNRSIVAIKGRNERDNREYRAQHDALCKQPIIVLVNQFSASASEIFAGAIQDNHRGVIIGPKGERTYGKASVQTISQLKHSLDKDEFGNYRPSGLRLTTAHYYTPSGKLIMDKGISPDIGIDLPAGHDSQLQEHGLLGQPNRLELETSVEGTTPTQSVAPKPEDDQKQPAAGDAAPPKDKTSTERLIQMLERSSKAQTEKKDEFHDILLDEAIKYLRAILIFESDKRAAA